ncbi:hypothetical protein GGR56DRAFT_672008 [Xylariaceae sp. FL0804]|nr:hypothetical protein GGR56DRAFT_672008 [Xylariaceae sp. FL0804]
MASYFDFGQNISYFTALLPRFYNLAGPGKKYFDPQNPRTFSGRLEHVELEKTAKLRAQRAEACSANAFEGLPLYAAGLVAGNAAGVPAATMNMLSVGYLAVRVVYSWVYIWGQENRKVAPMRTLSWLTGTGLIMTMFVKAGLRT